MDYYYYYIIDIIITQSRCAHRLLNLAVHTNYSILLHKITQSRCAQRLLNLPLCTDYSILLHKITQSILLHNTQKFTQSISLIITFVLNLLWWFLVFRIFIFWIWFPCWPFLVIHRFVWFACRRWKSSCCCCWTWISISIIRNSIGLGGWFPLIRELVGNLPRNLGYYMDR